ncbi:hypothetical protein N2152v2_008034 [Parachlorella kessleri]
MDDALAPEEVPQVPGLEAVPTSEEEQAQPPAAASEGASWREEAPGDELNMLHSGTAAVASLYEGGREVLAEDGYHSAGAATGGEGWTVAQGEAAAGAQESPVRGTADFGDGALGTKEVQPARSSRGVGPPGSAELKPAAGMV